MEQIFEFCESLTQLDLSSFDTSSVVWGRSMFRMCENLNEILVGNGWKVDLKDWKFGGMFANCGVSEVTYVSE